MSIHNLLWKVFNREENGYFLVYTFLLRLLWQALVNHNCLGFKRFALSVHFCNITWNFSWNVSAHIIGVFIARGKEDALVTLNMVPGETVYGEKKIVVEVSIKKPRYFHWSYRSSVYIRWMVYGKWSLSISTLTNYSCVTLDY